MLTAINPNILNLHYLYINLTTRALNKALYIKNKNNLGSSFGLKKKAAKELGVSVKTLTAYMKNYSVYFCDIDQKYKTNNILAKEETYLLNNQ